MFAWEYARYKHTTYPEQISVAIADVRTELTAEEIARLAAVRARYQGHPKCVEFDLDERRLTFVRWLVDNGRLSEGL
jgi:hypothetical protein